METSRVFPAATSLPSETSAAFLSTIKASALNVTSLYLRQTSVKDIAYIPLRGLSKLDNLLVHQIPDFILRNTHRAAQAISAFLQPAADAGAGAMADAAIQAVAGEAIAPAVEAGWQSFFVEVFQASTFKSYFGMLHYLTSRWAITCFTMALILNRVQIYASSRQRIFLTWPKRLALRIIPILLLLNQIHNLLQAIRCQSSPEFSLYRHGDINKYSLFDWAPEGGFLYELSSKVLYAATDEDACAAVGMSRPAPGVRARHGSFSLLWPTFMRLCVSHLVETISCHLQQLPVMTEVGMSVFEHSLAFSESETMISHTLGLGMFGAPKSMGNATASNATMIPASGAILAIADATTSLTGPHRLDRVNVPVEVLLVALLSCCNALTSNLVSVFNKQRSLRLINTGIWGMCFIASFIWGFFNTSTMVRPTSDGESADLHVVSGLLHFPTVAIIGFLPHIIILFGMWMCATIYALALILTALSLNSNPNIPRPTSFIDRFIIAHDNLQAAIQVRGISIKWHEDFYTALLRVGFTALTAASEAVFLNEGRSVEMRQFTWLEEERLDEIEISRGKSASTAEDAPFQIAEEYGLPPSSPGASDRGGKWESGYAKERKLEKEKENGGKNSDSIVYPNPRTGGVGAVQRTTRFYLLFIYIRGVIFLTAGYIAFGFGTFLDCIGVTTRPRWLRRLVGRSLKRAHRERTTVASNNNRYPGMDFWFMTEAGTARPPQSLDTDIEPEMRRRLALEHSGNKLERALDQRMYEWWKGNGWYGTRDESGDYQPSQQDELEDTTSVVSMSSMASTSDDSGLDDRQWESESEGRRTPTQRSPSTSVLSHGRSRSPTPSSTFHDTPLDTVNLARLLNPPDRASREEARMLASHFSAAASGNSIMTRSRYRHELEMERSRVLLAGRQSKSSSTAGPTFSLYHSPASHEKRPLTPAEESETLERLILSRRRRPHPQARLPDEMSAQDDPSSSSSSTGAGAACVVCQAAPRTIIAWPCRCLCVCEDCRVNLALNNFGNCVTCRRSVGGFVRLWVP